MKSLRSAFIGSGVATFVVTSIMAEKTAMGYLPQFSIARGWAEIAGVQPWVGWVINMLVGLVVGGLLFAALYDKLPGRWGFLKGIVFGFASWVLMMLVFMPLAGAGLFAMQAGSNFIVFTLALGVIYGLVLGATYAWDRGPATASS